MRIELLEAKVIARRLKALIEKHDSISMAVAWGDLTGIAEILVVNQAKFGSVLFGLDFCATDPDLIDELVDVPNAFVAKRHSGCFHPKIFYFQTGSKAEAIVGSANFTKGGLGNNLEASVHVKGDAGDVFFGQVRAQLESYESLYRPIDQRLADSYRRQAKVARKAPRPKSPVLPDDDGGDWGRYNSPLAIMPWKEFVRLVREDPRPLKKRMGLIREVQKMFVKTASFADLSVAEWKAVAGLLGRAEAETTELDGFEWGWFGSMSRATEFSKAIGLQESAIAQALDLVPTRGDVTRAQFDDYVDIFKRALPTSVASNPIATATRMLAMKRPDFFVCVDAGNKPALAEALAFAPTTISLDKYWERIIEPIQQAPWYNEPRPAGRNRDLWDARVAMLDAIYYEPVD